MTGPDTTIVHLVRHGEVRNQRGVLYGRLPGYVLSDLGHSMARRLAESFAGHDVVHAVASPLERAQQTATPTAAVFGLELRADERLIEASNVFEGKTFGVGDGSLRRPSHWRYLINPVRPSWGEPYVQIARRMNAALAAARNAARGHEAVAVSHQLPIWVARLAAEHRKFLHDPRKRQCSLASVTSFTYADDELVAVHYSEPARDLVPVQSTPTFSAGA